MTSFEQRIAAELQRMAGPRRALDTPSIRRRAQALPHGRWPIPMGRVTGSTTHRPAVFAAFRLAAAVAIVILFGGFLAAAFLFAPADEETPPAAVTESPSMPTIEALPAGAVVEELAPGIVRLLDDGVGHNHREWEGDQLRELRGIHAASDGSVWVVSDPPWEAWRVGIPGRHETTSEGFPGESWWGMPLLASTPDGTLWAGGSHLASYDGEEWTRHDPRETSGPSNDHFKFSRAITVQPDGALWAAWYLDIGRFGPDGWDITGSDDPPEGRITVGERCNYPFTDFTRRIVSLSDGSLVAGGPGCLARFDGASWQTLASPEIGGHPMSDEIRTGGSGVLWAHLNTAEYMAPSEDYLARFDGTDWSVFPVSDGLIRLHTVDSSTVDPKWRVDRDGVAWLLAERVPDAGDTADPGERRLWSFDGNEWQLRAKDIEWFTIDRRGTVWTSAGAGTSYLDGEEWQTYPRVTDVFDLDVADDGTVWALGDEHSIYVIDPEAPTFGGGSSDLPFIGNDA